MTPAPRIRSTVTIMASKTPDGFTLIELLVAAAIIIVVTGGVIVNYNSFNDTQKIRQAALTVKNNLRLAQSRAYNGEKPANGCTELAGYLATFAPTSYAVQVQCDDGLVEGTEQIYPIDAGLSLSSTSPTLLFRVLSRGMNEDVTVTVTGVSRSYQFRISRSGDMSDVIISP